MSDDVQDIERRAPRSRREERRDTAIGFVLALGGLAVVLLPLVRTGGLTTVPAVVGVVVLACGCLLITPGVFVPIVKQAISLLPSLRR